MSQQQDQKEELCRQVQHQIERCRKKSKGRPSYPYSLKQNILNLIDRHGISSSEIQQLFGICTSQIAYWRKCSQKQSMDGDVKILDVKAEQSPIIKLSFEWGTLELFTERKLL